jgi:hypothetical protein
VKLPTRKQTAKKVESMTMKKLTNKNTESEEGNASFRKRKRKTGTIEVMKIVNT